MINKLKRNKSPGPDGIPVEFYKWLNAESLHVILEILNEFWREGSIASIYIDIYRHLGF